MPFTFAHPAIILPLGMLRRFSLTALVIGSIIPDFEFFIFLTDKSKHSHTWLGVLYFDLPLAFFIAYVYHNLLKKQLAANLPAFFSGRIHVFNSFDWNVYVRGNFFVVLISFLIGISSHLLWDMFTHYDIEMFTRFPWMLYPIRFSDTYVIGLFVLLWYLSSLFGVAILVFILYKLPKYPVPQIDSILRFWRLATLISIAAVGARLSVKPNFENPPEVIIVLIGAFLWGVVFTSFLLKLTRKRSAS